MEKKILKKSFGSGKKSFGSDTDTKIGPALVLSQGIAFWVKFSNLPYLHHYKLRLVFFLPHFSLQLILRRVPSKLGFLLSAKIRTYGFYNIVVDGRTYKNEILHV